MKTAGFGGGEDKVEITTPHRNVARLQNIATTDLTHSQDKPAGESQGSESSATNRALPKGSLELRKKLPEVNCLAPNSTVTKKQGGDLISLSQLPVLTPSLAKDDLKQNEPEKVKNNSSLP